MPNDADRAGTPAGVFGAELRFYRTRAGLSHKDLAARVTVSNDVISKIETDVLERGGARAGRVCGVTRLGELLRVAEQHQVPRRSGHRQHVGQRQLARLVDEQGVHAVRQPGPRP